MFLIRPLVHLLSLTLLAGLLTACGAHAGVGIGIPGTPISVGASVPVDQRRANSADVRYLQIPVESTPPGAEVHVDGQLVGSTPATVSVPFDRNWRGRATGSAQVTVRRPGYLPEGVRVFAVDGNRISLSDGGQPVDRLQFTLRPQ